MTITHLAILPDLTLKLTFENGRTVRLPDVVAFTGVFAPLADPAFFAQAIVNADLGTVCWPNGAAIDPDVLYSAATGEPLPRFPETRIA